MTPREQLDYDTREACLRMAAEFTAMALGEGDLYEAHQGAREVLALLEEIEEVEG